MQFNEGELGCAIDGHEQVELALFGTDFGEIDVEVADRIGLELFPRGLVAVHVRQAADAMSLQTAVQRRAGQMWDGLLQGVEAVVEWQQRVLAEGNDYRLVFDR